MTALIHGIGTALPATRMTQEQGARVAQVLCLDARQAPLIPTLYRQTGVTGRNLVLGDAVVEDVLGGTNLSGSVFLPSGQPGDCGPTTRERLEVYNEEAPKLAARAAERALGQGGVLPAAVTHLVTVSCTGFAAPGVDVELIAKLGLRATTERTQVGFMGCHGALNGLRVARGLLAADDKAVVLLCAVELCSIHYHYGWDPKRVVSNALFADGAAAAVVGSSRTPGAWRIAANGACIFPDSAWAMTWDIGDHGFAMTLSTKVPNLIGKHLRPWLESWLAGQNLGLGGVRSWAIHPGGPRVLSVVAEALGLPASATEVSRLILEAHGNMSSPTLLFILNRLMLEDAPRPCVALGFGPGLAVEAALFA